MTSYPPIDETPTKVAGVTMGPDADKRQAALEEVRGLMEADPSKTIYLELIPEPDNKFDADAIKVVVYLPSTEEEFQLGYIGNSKSQCGFCHRTFSRTPKDNKCTRCKRTDSIVRDALASTVSRQMEEYSDFEFYGQVLQVTGGPKEDMPDRSFGCNFEIRCVRREHETD